MAACSHGRAHLLVRRELIARPLHDRFATSVLIFVTTVLSIVTYVFSRGYRDPHLCVFCYNLCQNLLQPLPFFLLQPVYLYFCYIHGGGAVTAGIIFFFILLQPLVFFANTDDFFCYIHGGGAATAANIFFCCNRRCFCYFRRCILLHPFKWRLLVTEFATSMAAELFLLEPISFFATTDSLFCCFQHPRGRVHFLRGRRRRCSDRRPTPRRLRPLPPDLRPSP